MKPPGDKKLAVRHTIFVCLTASFLATGGFQVLIISKCMHGLQACLFKYITVAEFHIWRCRLNGRLEAMYKIVMEITLLVMENHGKIMELCFWISVGILISDTSHLFKQILMSSAFFRQDFIIETKIMWTLNRLLPWEQSGPEVIKLFFMLNSTEHEITTGHYC